MRDVGIRSSRFRWECWKLLTSYSIMKGMTGPTNDLEANVATKLGNAMHSARASARRGAWISSLLVVFPMEFLLLAGIMLDPKPYYWLVALEAGGPWVAFVLFWRFPRLVSFSGGWADKHAAWVLAVLLISLPTRIAYYYVSLQRETPMILAACILGVLLCAAAMLLDPELRAKRQWVILPFLFYAAFIYAYATAFQMNCVLDNSPTAIHRSVVRAKFHVGGLSYHPDDQLQLAPWGTEEHALKAAVPPRFFADVHEGDTVCAVQRDGWLRMRWFTVQACSWTGSPVPFGDVGGGRVLLTRLRAIWK